MREARLGQGATCRAVCRWGSGGRGRGARAAERGEHLGDGGRCRDHRAYGEPAPASHADAKVDVEGSLQEGTPSADKIGAILDTRTASPAAQLKALNASVRIDNPTLHSPETMACVECHVASGARKSLLAAQPALKARIDPANVFSAPMTTRHVASKDAGNLHSFSWKGSDIGISDRAANESANVAAKMNELLF